jgi:hypothetical protein
MKRIIALLALMLLALGRPALASPDSREMVDPHEVDHTTGTLGGGQFPEVAYNFYTLYGRQKVHYSIDDSDSFEDEVKLHIKGRLSPEYCLIVKVTEEADYYDKAGTFIENKKMASSDGSVVKVIEYGANGPTNISLLRSIPGGGLALRYGPSEAVSARYWYHLSLTLTHQSNNSSMSLGHSTAKIEVR